MFNTIKQVNYILSSTSYYIYKQSFNLQTAIPMTANTPVFNVLVFNSVSTSPRNHKQIPHYPS